MAKVSDLKNIKGMGYKQIAVWGIIGSVVLFLYSLIATILAFIIPTNFDSFLFSIIGLILGIIYAIIGIFGVILVVREKQGDYWWLFLIGSILAILSPLGWFGWAGIGVSLIAGIVFVVYYYIEKR